MTEIERCWCDMQVRPCTNRVTQEDMRCDICRGGCHLLVNGDWHAHVGEVQFDIRMTPPSDMTG